MHVIEISRWNILVQSGDKVVHVACEMLIPTPGMSDYLIFTYAVHYEGEPLGSSQIDEATKEAAINAACEALSKEGRIVELVHER